MIVSVYTVAEGMTMFLIICSLSSPLILLLVSVLQQTDRNIWCLISTVYNLSVSYSHLILVYSSDRMISQPNELSRNCCGKAEFVLLNQPHPWQKYADAIHRATNNRKTATSLFILIALPSNTLSVELMVRIRMHSIYVIEFCHLLIFTKLIAFDPVLLT